MGRLAVSAGIAAALVATAVAVGAGSDLRIHRLHLPPPPTVGGPGSDQPLPPGTTDPTGPGTSPPAPPAPPSAQPPPPPGAPPSTIGCTVAGDVPGGDVTGTLSDYSIALSAPSVNAAPSLRFRGTYPTGADTHNFTLRDSSHTTVCGTTNLLVGAAGTFTVTNLPPGSYELVCTIHVAYGMRVAFTVN
jgi:hypothetical protein